MSRSNALGGRLALVHVALLASIVSVAVTLIALRLVVPLHANAQASQLGDIRATSLTLVGSDGAVLGRLSTGAAGGGTLELFNAAGGIMTRIQTGGGGGGNVQLFDVQGNRRLTLAGEGALNVLDPSGVLTFRAGNTLTTTQNGPPFNGVQLDVNGSIGVIPPSP